MNVVCDASTLIAPARIGQLDILPQVGAQVVIPMAVYDEVCPAGYLDQCQVMRTSLGVASVVVYILLYGDECLSIVRELCGNHSQSSPIKPIS